MRKSFVTRDLPFFRYLAISAIDNLFYASIGKS